MGDRGQAAEHRGPDVNPQLTTTATSARGGRRNGREGASKKEANGNGHEEMSFRKRSTHHLHLHARSAALRSALCLWTDHQLPRYLTTQVGSQINSCSLRHLEAVGPKASRLTTNTVGGGYSGVIHCTAHRDALMLCSAGGGVVVVVISYSSRGFCKHNRGNMRRSHFMCNRTE